MIKSFYKSFFCACVFLCLARQLNIASKLFAARTALLSSLEAHERSFLDIHDLDKETPSAGLQSSSQDKHPGAEDRSRREILKTNQKVKNETDLDTSDQHRSTGITGNHDIYKSESSIESAAATAAESVIQAKIESLEKFNVSFYIYDDPNITLPENVHGDFARGPAKWKRYSNEVKVDEQILAALEKSALRTHDHTKATLFIPPVPFGKIITSKRPHNYIHGAMNSLLAHDIFKRHQGHNHLIISTSYTFFRGAKLGDFNPLKPYYSRIYNATAILCWDPSATHNDLHHTNNDWSEFRQDFIKETTPPLISRTASVAFGIINDKVPLTLATPEKHRNSSNFIFYHSRTSPSVNNSTIFRHAPITNITQDSNFPKSSIGFDIEKDQWIRDYKDSKFCLVVRGDNPGSHALIRSIRVGCIPVIAADTLPVWGPILKSSLNMSDYGVLVDEKAFVNDPTSVLLKLKEISEDEIEAKIKHLAFAQRVIFTDHPNSLFVPALLKEAQMASTVV